MCLRRVLAISVIALILVVVLTGIQDRPGSFLRGWLYENNDTKELVVATVALTPAKASDATLEKIAQMMSEIVSANSGVDLIVFGEVITGWYRSETPSYHHAIAEPIPGPTTQDMARLALTHNVYLSFGMVERSNGKVYNSQVFISRSGQILDVHRKMRLKSESFDPGSTPISLVEVDGITFGDVICYDMRWRDTIDIARKGQADVILLSNADYIDAWDRVRFGYQYLAKQYSAWIVTANRFGDEFGTHWDGHIEIMDPFGGVVAAGEEREGYLIETLKINTERSKTRRWLHGVFSKVSLAFLVLRHPLTAYGYV